MRKTFLLLPFLLLALGGCETPNREEGFSVYATCYSLYDFAKRIGGDLVKVKNLIPPGGEPHEYEPTPKDLGKMSEANALLYNGLGMESWLDSLFANPSSKEAKELVKKSHCLSKNIEVLKIDGISDPHIWLSPKNAVQELKDIAAIFSELDPENASTYALNLENETKKMEALHQEAAVAFAGMENKNIVVAHAAFGYMAHEYDLTQHYVSGLSPDAEPTAQDLEALIRTVEETQVDTIFTEELFSAKIAEKLAAETGCEVKLLYTLESLTEEQLSQSEDYLSLYRKNIKTITGGAA